MSKTILYLMQMHFINALFNERKTHTKQMFYLINEVSLCLKSALDINKWTNVCVKQIIKVEYCME